MVTRRVHLTFPEVLVQEPVIYNMGKRFDVVTNVRRANVEDTYGWVILEMSGDDAALKRALEYAEGLGVQINPIEDVVEG
ncbi:MAG: NIL domain-containing protein [Actinomycetota bacterium]|nr:NIL domain-containing protein [Actinomycetota bacterium]